MYHYAGNNPVRYTDPTGLYSWDEFKNDVTPAVNLDFGMDYARAAEASWNNGKYLQAGIYELDATCEMAYDGVLAYAGAQAIDITIKSIAMLAGTIASLSSNSTVVLGKYNSGACGSYTKMAEQIGAKCFQIPKLMYKVLDVLGLGKKLNSAWLDGVIKSGARILLNSNPIDAIGTDTSYGMEMETLQNAGYKFIEIVEKGIQCWEAVKE